MTGPAPDSRLAAALAAPGLPPGLGAALEILGGELLRWNRTHNLTGHRDLPSVRRDLFLDGLALLPHLAGAGLLDIGAGAGFPGLVLALARPGLLVTLLEPRAKRVSFIKHAIRTLGLLDRVEAVAGRAPEALPGRRFATVTLRAVTDLAGSLALARPYLAPGGRLVLPRGAKDASAAAALGGRVVEYRLTPEGEPRLLAIWGG